MLNRNVITILDDTKQVHLMDYLTNSMVSSHVGQIPFSRRLAKYLFTTNMIDIIDAAIFCANLIFPINYAIQTYSDDQTIAFTIQILEITLCIVLLVNYFINLYITESIINYIISFSSLIDYVTIVPIMLSNFGYDYISLHYVRVCRIASCFTMEKFFSRKGMLIAKRFFRFILLLMSLILIGGSAVLEIENYYYNNEVSNTTGSKQKLKILQFHDIIYYMVTTISTFGYGDIVPNQGYSKLVILGVVVIFFALFPPAIQDLYNVLHKSSQYTDNKYESRSIKHIIIMGKFTSKELRPFLEELYHSDHKGTDLHTVIIQNEHPTSDMQMLLKQQRYIQSVFYLNGDPMNPRDLKRANAEEAICSVVLSRVSQSGEVTEDDYYSILQALSIKSYTKKKQGIDMRICIQLNLPMNKDIYEMNNSSFSNKIDQVICNEEIKLRLLAKNCLCPGIITIIASLLTTSVPNLEENYPTFLSDYNKHTGVLSGMQCEIYRVLLRNEVYGGNSFSSITLALYKECSIMAFALEVDSENERKVFVNPSEYVLNYHDYYGYVIDTSMPDMAKINNNDIRKTLTLIQSFSSCKTQATFGDFYCKEAKIYKKKRDGSNIRRKNYLMALNPIDYYDARIQSVYGKNFSKHIIVCGYTDNFELLISTLRPKIFGNRLPKILILSGKGIRLQWDKIKFFNNVFIIKGSPLNIIDLERAGVRKASVVLLLQKISFGDNQNDESEIIFVYKTIKNINPSAHIITELNSLANIQLLAGSKDEAVYKKYGFWASEPMISGELYLPHFLDTIVCQAFYNPFIVRIMEQFLLGNANTTKEDESFNQAYNLLECSIFLFNPPLAVRELHKFGKIYEELIMHHKMISIGIYKKLSKKSKPFVLINPPKDETVDKFDMLYVLFPHEPTMTYTENLEESFDDKKSYDGMLLSIKEDELKMKVVTESREKIADIKLGLRKLETILNNTTLIN